MSRPLKPLPALLLSLLVPCLLQAQSPPPDSPAPPGASITTLKASARLVVVDVVVTDHNQNPVHNLKQSDFTLLEANVPQKISHFEEHIAAAPHATQSETVPPLPPGTFTNFTPSPPSDSLNILLLDTLNTPLQDQSYVREQLKQYLKTAKPGSRTAIFGLTTRLLLLQGFTSNPEILKAILDRKGSSASRLLNDQTGSGGPGSITDQLSDTFGADPAFAALLANIERFQTQQESFQLQLRSKYTLDAMNILARYLSVFPGRKNLIWFSASFPISILPDGDLANPFVGVASSENEFRETARLLTAAQVAVYPVDARGIFNNPSLDAANPGTKFRSPAASAKDQVSFFEQTADENGTMFEMAQETGGQAFLNTNDLSQAVASAIENGSNFYTLVYAPSDAKSDGSFRKIQLKLQQQGLNLAYRRGYYTADSSGRKQPNSTLQSSSSRAKDNPTPPRAVDPVRNSMLHGSPDPTQIIFKARILPAPAVSEDTPVPGSNLNPAAKVSGGPYRRYLIDLASDPRAFFFARSSDGHYHSDVELRAYVYDHDGAVIISSTTATHLNLTSDELVSLLKQGLHLHREISVPLKGDYFIRVGLHDPNSDHLGSIEVPVASIRSLPPLVPPAPSTPDAAPVAP